MHGIHGDIESRLNNRAGPTYKSGGERKIAYFLDKNDIKYQYEPAILVNSPEGKPRIWYPDFYLSEFGSYIEYYGLVGNRNYDRGVKAKEIVYSKAGLHVIPVDPWMFNKNWQRYIMKELKTTSRRRYRNLMTKRYWSHQKSFSYGHSFFQRGYHHKSNYRY